MCKRVHIPVLLAIGAGLLAGCPGRISTWQYSADMVNGAEVALTEYYRLKGEKPQRITSSEDYTRVLEEMMSEAQKNPELGMKIQQRTSLEMILRLNNAGARGWDLAHVQIASVGPNLPFPVFTFIFKKPGVGPLDVSELDLEAAPTRPAGTGPEQ